LVGVTPPTAAASTALVYLILGCSVSAYLLVNYGLSHVSANKVSTFANLVPVVAVTAAYLVLGERLTAAQFAAGAVVIVGVWLANRKVREPRSPSAG
jgi:drug/metabolite transporter (DMT)-like permease